MRDLSKLLNPDDHDILNALPGQNWIPKEPAEILLPYIEETEVDRSSIDFRRQKAKEVMDGYSNIINKCKEVESMIENRCKAVKITLSPKNNLRTIEALTRVFGIKSNEITFEHYKKCIEALAEINSQVPTLG